MEIVLMVLAFGALMYFMMIRPAQKKMKEQQAMQSALGEGSRVMLTSGIFATVKHLGDQQAVVELAPGVDVTVVRGAISRTLGADEEEFEYEDAAPAGQVAPGAIAGTEGALQSYAPYGDAPYADSASVAAAPAPYADAEVVDASVVDVDPYGSDAGEPAGEARPLEWQNPYADDVENPRKDA